MPSKSTLRPVWSEKHREYMRNAKKATLAVAEGAVRAGKTVDNVAVFANLIDSGTPDKIHLATGSTAANAKLNIGDCNGMGLEWIFRGRCHWGKYKGNEALIIQSHGRQYIVIFAGGAKADSYKKIHGNSYGMWIATEIDLHHDKTIKEAFDRQLAAKNRHILWDLNPGSPAANIYKEYIDKFPEQFGESYCYQHFTIRDNMTITPERLAEIEKQYAGIWYRRNILGERCNAEGVVYDMFDPAKHILTPDKLPPTEGAYFVSCDYGTQNPMVFLLWRKVAGTGNGTASRWVMLREYYYSGREQRRQKTDTEYADDLGKWLDGITPQSIIIDPSAASMIAELRKRHYPVQSARNDVEDGIRSVAQLIANDRIIVCSECKRTIEEFGIYSWDEKAAERGTEAPLKTNDHGMDAMRYFVYTKRLAITDGSRKPSASTAAFM